MSDAVRMDLEQSIRTDLLNCEGRCRREETSILNFFNGFADGEDKSAVDKRKDDVGVIGVFIEDVNIGNESSMKQHLPSSVRFVVQTALGIPGNSELTDSSTSRPCLSVRRLLRAPRPQAANICGVSEFGRRLRTFESMMGSNDSSSSARAKFSRGRGVKYARGSPTCASDIPKSVYEVELNSGSLSSSPSFWNW